MNYKKIFPVDIKDARFSGKRSNVLHSFEIDEATWLQEYVCVCVCVWPLYGKLLCVRLWKCMKGKPRNFQFNSKVSQANKPNNQQTSNVSNAHILNRPYSRPSQPPNQLTNNHSASKVCEGEKRSLTQPQLSLTSSASSYSTSQ